MMKKMIPMPRVSTLRIKDAESGSWNGMSIIDVMIMKRAAAIPVRPVCGSIGGPDRWRTHRHSGGVQMMTAKCTRPSGTPVTPKWTLAAGTSHSEAERCEGPFAGEEDKVPQRQIDTHWRAWCKPSLVAGTKDEVAMGGGSGSDVVLDIRPPGSTFTDDAFPARVRVDDDLFRAHKHDGVTRLHPRSRIRDRYRRDRPPAGEFHASGMNGNRHEEPVATETGDEPVGGSVVKRFWRADLFHLPATHDRDT